MDETTIVAMGLPPTTAVPVRPDAANAPFTYRCVCGESFVVDRGESGRCPKCGRHFTPDALAGNLAETMSIRLGGSSAELSEVAPRKNDNLIGQTLDHFRIVALLGRGGMGTVYQAIDESLQRYVALKVIRLDEGGSPEHYQRLVQEARAQARVNHPHVVHIYYVGLNESSPFFAMELIAGRTLAERLRQGPLPFDEVVSTGLQVVSALERAAQFDIIHGDIKPSNILQVDAHTVKISDFGLSRRLSQTESGSGAVAGTPVYLSPEAARGETTDIRSDMYSLGVTLFELTFARLPYEFVGETLQQKLDAHVAQQPAFPDPWPVSVPQAWREVLEKLLEKDPTKRFATHTELDRELRRLMPVERIPAARLPRTLAWLSDMVIFSVGQGVALAPATAMSLMPDANGMTFIRFVASMGGFLIAGAVFLIGMYFQCTGGRTFGKSLFQLRIVDRHGLSPGKSVLAIRFVMQFLPLTGIFAPILGFIGLAGLNTSLIGAGWIVVLVSGSMMLFSKTTASLHDRMLGTRVVVDAQ